MKIRHSEPYATLRGRETCTPDAVVRQIVEHNETVAGQCGDDQGG